MKMYYYYDKVPCYDIDYFNVLSTEYTIRDNDESTKKIHCLITRESFFTNDKSDYDNFIYVYQNWDDNDLFYIDNGSTSAICSFDKDKLLKSHKERLEWFKQSKEKELDKTNKILEEYEKNGI